MYMMSAAWASLAFVFSALGALYGFVAWKRQGLHGLVRGAALVVLPIALWLTGTLRLAGAIVDWVARWSTGLVLSPSVVLGTALLVLALVLFGVSGRIAPRERERASRAGVSEVRPRPARRGAPAVQDDDLADIEALLRQRGIR